MGIDYDARLLAYKILTIVFIVITIVTNAEYLVRYFRAPKVFYRAGHLGKITLALGSIFLALFSYVVNAQILFEDESDLSCRTSRTALDYHHYFFPFVVGFIILSSSFSLYLSQRGFCTSNAKLMSLAAAVFPWLLAVVVVCPLAFVGTDWEDHCDQDFTFDRMRALHVVSVLLPATFALLCCIVLNVVTKTNTQQSFTTRQNAVAENMPQSYATASNNDPNTHVAMLNFQQTQPQLGFQGTTQYPQSQQGIPHYPQQYPQQNPQYYPTPNAQQYPQYHPQTMPVYGGSFPQPTAPAASEYLTLQQVAVEKSGLLWASLIFFFSVLPLTLFILGYTLNDDPDVRRNADRDAIIVIQDICFWTFHLYPVLIPIAWRGQVRK